MVTLPVERYVYIPYVLCWLYLPDIVLAAYEMITVEVGLPIFSPSGSNPVHTLMGLLQLEVWKIDKGSEQLVQPSTQPTGVHTCSCLLMSAHGCSCLLMAAHGCSWLWSTGYQIIGDQVQCLVHASILFLTSRVSNGKCYHRDMEWDVVLQWVCSSWSPASQ